MCVGPQCPRRIALGAVCGTCTPFTPVNAGCTTLSTFAFARQVLQSARFSLPALPLVLYLTLVLLCRAARVQSLSNFVCVVTDTLNRRATARRQPCQRRNLWYIHAVSQSMSTASLTARENGGRDVAIGLRESRLPKNSRGRTNAAHARPK